MEQIRQIPLRGRFDPVHPLNGTMDYRSLPHFGTGGCLQPDMGDQGDVEVRWVVTYKDTGYGYLQPVGVRFERL